MKEVLGANIEGNVNTGGGDVVGRDQIIQNIVIVGKFLDLIGIQELLPIQSTGKQGLNNIGLDRLNEILDKQIPPEFSDSIEFVGQVLVDFLTSHQPKDQYSTISIRNVVFDLGDYIGKKLWDLNYWNSFYEESHNGKERFITLSATTELCSKFWIVDTKQTFALMDVNYSTINSKSPTYRFMSREPGSIFSIIDFRHYSTYQCRMFMLGVVIDLIKLHSKACDDIQFWKSIIQFIEAHKNTS